jgi:hypothetical protein
MCAADDPPLDPHAAAAIARAEWRLATLQELAEIGMALTRDLARQAAEPPAEDKAAPRRDPGDGFARLSRAIRLTLALHARTDGELAQLHAGVAIEVERRREAVAIRDQQTARKRSADHRAKVRREVETAFDIEFGEQDSRRGAFCRSLDDCLLYHERFADLESMTLTEAVRGLCAELGLAPDWSRWTEDGWTYGAKPVLAEGEQVAPAIWRSG